MAITLQALIRRYANDEISRNLRKVFPRDEWGHLGRELYYHTVTTTAVLVLRAAASEITDLTHQQSENVQRWAADLKQDALDRLSSRATKITSKATRHLRNVFPEDEWGHLGRELYHSTVTSGPFLIMRVAASEIATAAGDMTTAAQQMARTAFYNSYIVTEIQRHIDNRELRLEQQQLARSSSQARENLPALSARPPGVEAFAFLQTPQPEVREVMSAFSRLRLSDGMDPVGAVQKLTPPEHHVKLIGFDPDGRDRIRLVPVDQIEDCNQVAFDMARQPEKGVYRCEYVGGDDPLNPNFTSLLFYIGQAVTVREAQEECAFRGRPTLSIESGVTTLVRTLVHGQPYYSVLQPGEAVRDPADGTVIFPLGVPSEFAEVVEAPHPTDKAKGAEKPLLLSHDQLTL